MNTITKSAKLDNVCYDIRGPVLDEANRLEAQGVQILKLNIGNPAPFGFEAPDDIIQAMTDNLRKAHGYSDSKGISSGRKAIAQYYRDKGVSGVEVDDVYIGNGVSELIMIAMQALLNNGDEILVPAPDYPLWTAAIKLAGGKAVHYLCDEQSDWYPDINDIKRKISAKTRGIVVINPNNPTGAVYPVEISQEIIKLAAEYGLIIFADEIYDQITYEDTKHTTMATLSEDILLITMSGLSKSHRIAGFRAGWLVISGNKKIAKDYITGLNLLTSMRLCSNVPAQNIIQTALRSYQSIKDLTKPGGRLKEQRDFAYQRINEIPGLSCPKPFGAFYLFPKIDTERFNIRDDERFLLDLLMKEHLLLVQGTAFNWPRPDHFRIVFLPSLDTLQAAFNNLERFLADYRQK